MAKIIISPILSTSQNIHTMKSSNSDENATVSTLQLQISGMTCTHCATGIERKFAEQAGILAKKVNYPEGTGTFTFDESKISKAEIMHVINQTGNYQVVGELNTNEGSSYDYDLIVIGGGSAAFSAAIKANELGKRILIVNGGLDIGGTCVNVGCVPSKYLIRAGESIHRASHSPFKGIFPNPPSWDFGELIRQKKALVAEMQQRKYVDVVAGIENIQIKEGFASFVDKERIQINSGETYTASKLIIATGATTFVPPIPGLSTVDYLTNVSLFELEEQPEQLIVLGAGYIGLEIAQAYHRMGTKVTVLQRSAHILSSQSPDVSDQLALHLRQEGIGLHTGIQFERISREGKEIVVEATEKGEAVSFRGSHLLVATGTKPNTEKLNLTAIGLSTDQGGFIQVNEKQETSVASVFAVGDCTDTPAYVYTAALEGKVAAENAFGIESNTDYTALPWVVFTDPQIAGVGIDETEAAAKDIPHETTVLSLAEVPRAIAALDTRGFIKLIRNPETDQLLGARIVAPEGGELVMELSLAIKYGITTEQLANAFHPYLTLSEGIKLAAITFGKDVKELSCCAV